MSHRIDKFVEAMFRKNAEALVMLTGTPVRILAHGEEKVILDKPVRTDQIDKLIAPILAADQIAVFEAEGEASFRYDSPHGAAQINTKRHGPKIAVEIVPVQGESEPPPPAAEPRKQSMPGPSERARSMGEEKIGAGKPLTRTFRLAGAKKDGAPAIDKIVVQLAKEGGSDLHMTTGQKPKMRKDGHIMDMPGWSDALSSDIIQEWMLEVASKRVREEFIETHDADYAYEVEGVSRYRMNLFRDRNGTGAVIRTIPSKILTFEKLNLPPVLKAFCELPKGMVLVTGPTGSGKSTTLAAMIDFINRQRADHIITIEDPVEFVHQSQKCLVNQREVHTHTESFGRALRAALREDPDIVLVGEMRDLETVHIAIETAETGHLVFGTLHTNTAASTVDRIIDQFPTDRQEQIRVMLSETLRGVVAQTLCRKIGGGRTAILEILVVNAAVANLIREGKTFQIASMMQTGKAIGMQTNGDAMLAAVREGLITPLEAYTKAIDQVTMKAILERNNYKLEAAD